MKIRLHLSIFIVFMFLSLSKLLAQENIPSFLKHTVQAGEGLSALSAQYNVSIKDLMLLNDFPSGVKLKTGQTVLIRLLMSGEFNVPNSTTTSTTVKQTIITTTNTAINKQTSITKEELTGPSGVKYQVTNQEYHIVQPAQTFYRISLIYGLSVEQLKSLNNMSNTDIKVGQKLKVK